MLKYTYLAEYLDYELLPKLARLIDLYEDTKDTDAYAAAMCDIVTVLAEKMLDDSMEEYDTEYNPNVIPFRRK